MSRLAAVVPWGRVAVPDGMNRICGMGWGINNRNILYIGFDPVGLSAVSF